MEILGKILGNGSRVKIMRLFLLNRTTGFKSKDVAKRSRVSSPITTKEIKLLSSVGFIKKRSATSMEWIFNPMFKYAKEFEDLLIGSDSLSNQTVLDSFKKIGRVKLLVVSGVFIKNNDSRVDLLIVGDKMKRTKIEEGIRRLEAEIGTELVYAIFESKEFMYRLNMYDKLVRDILDFPHEVIIQGKGFLELSTQAPRKAVK
ncbi:MAG TPA: hypothetical protein VGO63_01745 [Candidatus Paceibacterota bacterium]|jgi:hypothetical protein|nr:hypothetical protein [Candidatus Paceibacterota bacterium]